MNTQGRLSLLKYVLLYHVTRIKLPRSDLFHDWLGD